LNDLLTAEHAEDAEDFGLKTKKFFFDDLAKRQKRHPAAKTIPPSEGWILAFAGGMRRG
jgi:hypothetical protein